MKNHLIINILAAASFVFTSVPANAVETVSGAPYDYTATMKPERPYMHQYDKLMMQKLFLARPDQKGGSNVVLSAKPPSETAVSQ